MELVEIRELEGPNLFLLEPAIKVEFAGELDASARTLCQNRVGTTVRGDLDLIERLAEAIHREAGLPVPAVVAVALETAGQCAVAFGWTHRRIALSIARAIAETVCGTPGAVDPAAVKAWLAAPEPDDAPLMLRDTDRVTRIVSVTGTNGKTTTTRLIAHIAMSTGLHVAWSSSSGVYLDGEPIVEGDYSGPAGARGALEAPGVDLAVLETARGGILLRGIAYESNDVSVFTNISADHLDLQGIRTVEGLAKTKAVVTRITRPGGVAVLNAADPLVMAATRDIRARKLLFALMASEPELASHLELGGEAVFTDEGWFVHARGEKRTRLLEVAAAPVTVGGAASHMTQNALAAIGATLGLGISPDRIAAALRTFRNSAELNEGRLNLFDVGEVTVILDFAHNEAGLEGLLDLARGLTRPGGAVISVIGTAGDRTDASLIAIGRIAAERSDRIVIKGTRKYLRGRAEEEMVTLHLAGIRQGPERPVETRADEMTAFECALASAQPGDVVALMAHEQVGEILARLREIGVPRT